MGGRSCIGTAFCVCLILLAGFASPALAAQRTALVIGNGAYKEAPLKNPVNDATDVAKALRDLGFEVIEKVNAGREEMDSLVEEFHRNLRKAQAGLFYYAGHGMQLDGVNYLLPVNIQVTSSADIRHKAINLDWILAKMEDSGSKLNIVVLDACRDNPFRGLRGSGSGLAAIQSVRGTFVAFATSPGSVAQDGAGRNGVFTSHLLKNIKKPNLTVEEIFREVRIGVVEETNSKQIPWDSSTLMGAFYIAGRASSGSGVEKPRTDVASVPSTPKKVDPGPRDANETGRDGVYIAYANGVVRDTSTGLEWVAGPDRDMTWDEARSWVESLKIDGGGWRMPRLDELEGLHKPGSGDRNMTLLLEFSGWYVWSQETRGTSNAWSFRFSKGERYWDSRDGSSLTRAFAVRSRGSG